MKKIILILLIPIGSCATTTKLTQTPSSPNCLKVTLSYANYSETFYACDSVQIQKVRQLVSNK